MITKIYPGRCAMFGAAAYFYENWNSFKQNRPDSDENRTMIGKEKGKMAGIICRN